MLKDKIEPRLREVFNGRNTEAIDALFPDEEAKMRNKGGYDKKRRGNYGNAEEDKDMNDDIASQSSGSSVSHKDRGSD